MSAYEYILIIGVIFAASVVCGFVIAQCLGKIEDDSFDEAQAEEDARRLKVAMNAPIKTVRKVRAGSYQENEHV